jgi:peptidylprolyl isomerase
MSNLPSGTITVGAVLAACALLIVGVSVWLGDGFRSAPADESLLLSQELPAPLSPEVLEAYDTSISNPMNPIAVLTTNRGVIEIELYKDVMPITAGNFEKLANEGFYDGTKFHRVIEGFMIQGGDPNSKTDNVRTYGTGGPGYAIADEHIKGDKLTNVRGTIAMANSGPNTGGSQFFINLVDNTFLDFDKEPLNSKHPVFGRVVLGMEVVDAIGQTETDPRDLPLEPVVVEKVEIRQPS